MKIKMISLILLTGMTTSSYAMSIYNKDGNTLDIYGRVEGKIASGENSYAGSETRTNLGGRLGIYLTRDLDFIPETKIVGRLEWQVRTEKNDSNTGDSDLKARYSYIGLSNKTWGELIVGRTKNPLYQVMKMTDKYKNFTPNIYSYGITTIDDSYQFNRQDGVKTTDGRNQNDQIMAGLQLSYKNVEAAVTALRTSIARDNKSDNDFKGMDSLLSWKYGKFKFLTGYSFLDEKDKSVYEKEDWRVETQITLADDTWLSFTYDKAFANKNQKVNDDALIVGLRYDF